MADSISHKMESVGTPHPYKSVHMTVGSSKSWVWEKILIIFLLYEGPGTEFWAMKFLGRLCKTWETHSKASPKLPRSSQHDQRGVPARVRADQGGCAVAVHSKSSAQLSQKCAVWGEKHLETLFSKKKKCLDGDPLVYIFAQIFHRTSSEWC